MADKKALLGLLRNMKQSEGGNQVNVQVINKTSVKANAETKAAPNLSGGIDLQVILTEVDKGLAGKINQGVSRLGNAVQSSFQLNDAAGLYKRG